MSEEFESSDRDKDVNESDNTKSIFELEKELNFDELTIKDQVNTNENKLPQIKQDSELNKENVELEKTVNEEKPTKKELDLKKDRDENQEILINSRKEEYKSIPIEVILK